MVINAIPTGIADCRLSAGMVDLKDYTDEHYSAEQLMEDPSGTPVVICYSKSDGPNRYRVVHGRNVMFFLTYKEVMDYCRKYECRRINGGEDNEI